jgi:hypothetical protein
MQGTTIEVAFEYDSASGESQRFILTHPFDFRFQSLARTLDENGVETGLLPSDRKLEVDVYGWSEIEGLGGSPEAQRDLIDRFAQTCVRFFSGATLTLCLQ